MHLTKLERKLLDQVILHPIYEIISELKNLVEVVKPNNDGSEENSEKYSSIIDDLVREKLKEGFNRIFITNPLWIERYRDEPNIDEEGYLSNFLSNLKDNTVNKIYETLTHEILELPKDEDILPMTLLNTITVLCTLEKSIWCHKLYKDSVRCLDHILFYLSRYLIESVMMELDETEFDKSKFKKLDGRFKIHEKPPRQFEDTLSYITANITYLPSLYELLKKRQFNPLLGIAANLRDEKLKYSLEGETGYVVIPSSKTQLNAKPLLDIGIIEPEKYFLCHRCRRANEENRCTKCGKPIEKAEKVIKVPETLSGEPGKILESLILLKIRDDCKDDLSIITHNVELESGEGGREIDIIKIKTELKGQPLELELHDIVLIECKMSCEDRDVEDLKKKVSLFSKNLSKDVGIKGQIYCLTDKTHKSIPNDIEIIEVEPHLNIGT